MPPQDQATPLLNKFPLSPETPADAQWFHTEVQPHEPALRAYLRRRFPQLGDVDDVVQESFLRVVKERWAGRLRSAKGFLFTAARNTALDLFRHRSVVQMDPLTESDASSVFSNEADVAEAASVSQELDLLAAALEDLPERCRQIIILRRIHGLSNREIAERLSISPHTVEKQIGIGLKKCTEFLRRKGVVRPE